MRASACCRVAMLLLLQCSSVPSSTSPCSGERWPRRPRTIRFKQTGNLCQCHMQYHAVDSKKNIQPLITRLHNTSTLHLAPMVVQDRRSWAFPSADRAPAHSDDSRLPLQILLSHGVLKPWERVRPNARRRRLEACVSSFLHTVRPYSFQD